jgi:DNA-binding transcriptional LysR family regulator
MNLRSLKYFLTVAEEKNISKAARRLFISQQTLSEAIRRLEEEYHTRLFEREPHIHLTEAGYYMERFAREVLKKEMVLTNELDSVTKNMRRHIMLGVTPVRARLILPEFLPYFHAKFPYLEISLSIGSYKRLEEQLAKGDLGAILSTLHPTAASFSNTLLYRDPFCFVIPPVMARRTMPLTLQKGKTILPYKECVEAELRSVFSQESFIRMSQSTIEDHGNAFFQKYKVTPRVLYSLHDLDTVLELCLKGMGYACSFRQYAEKKALQCSPVHRTQPLFVTIPEHESQVAIMTAPHREENYSMQVFVRELKGRFSQYTALPAI